MNTGIHWFCLLVSLLTVVASFQQDGTLLSNRRVRRASDASFQQDGTLPSNRRIRRATDASETLNNQNLVDRLEKKISYLLENSMIPIYDRFDTVDDDIRKLQSNFEQHLADLQDKISQKLEEKFLVMNYRFNSLGGDNNMDSTSASLHNEQCTEGSTWTQECNGCLCLNGKSVCSNKFCDWSKMLYNASWDGDLSAVNTALAAGASVNWRSGNVTLDVGRLKGFTALHAAAVNNHLAVIELLLAAGADKNEQVDYGFTSMSLASIIGHSEVVGSLIAHGADVTIRDNQNGTALHMAAVYNHPNIVEQLLAAGADVTARDDFWGTPSMMARGRGYDTLADYIDNYTQDSTITAA